MTPSPWTAFVAAAVLAALLINDYRHRREQSRIVRDLVISEMTRGLPPLMTAAIAEYEETTHNDLAAVLSTYARENPDKTFAEVVREIGPALCSVSEPDAE